MPARCDDIRTPRRMTTLAPQPYLDQRSLWPQSGRHILAHYDATTIVVYQAYRNSIGHYAAEHGHFGGEFSLDRMSWIKPNFLWMMYRSGWGQKEGQTVVLAVRMLRSGFDEILRAAVHSSYVRERYESRDSWQRALKRSDVRLQWDPDHAPRGAKEERRAIQLGLRGETLRRYAREWVVSIEDVSAFVAEQRVHLGDLSALHTPSERVYPAPDDAVAAHLGLSKQ